MEQVALIVWRESVEALLVVGILYVWLRRHPQGRRGMPYLWGGVVAGLGLALGLALVLLGLSSWLSEDGQEWFQAGMSWVACLLVVHMVMWMRQHGRTLKNTLEAGAQDEVQQGNWWGLWALVMIAVAREGNETVVFLYGTVAAARTAQNSVLMFVAAAVAGFSLALLTFWVLQWGGRRAAWQRFFWLTERVMLLLASALLVAGLDRLISLGVVPPLIDPVWDSSGWLSDSHGVGKFLAEFAGYRAYPALTSVLMWIGYWLVVGFLLRHTQPPVAVKTAAWAQRPAVAGFPHSRIKE